MADVRIFRDVMSEIVDEVRISYDSENKVPYFLSGPLLEILKILTEKSENQFVYGKYPLVALIHDFRETDGGDSTEYLVSPRIFILCETSRDYHPDQRYDNSYRTILYPIHDLIKREICLNPDIYQSFVGELRFDKFDRLHWGTESAGGNSGLILNDYLDGIEFIPKDLRIFRYVPVCETIG